MGNAGSPGRPGPAGRYLSGLCAAGLVLCAAGWLVLTPFASGYRASWHDAALTDLATGAGLVAVCLVTLVAWAVVWRRALRADGVLTHRPRGRSRGERRVDRDGGAVPAPGPDQVLTALRELLTPMLYPPAIAAAEPVLAGASAAGEEPPATAEPPVAEPVPAAAPAAAKRRVAAAAPAAAVVPEPRDAAAPRNGAGTRHAAERSADIASIESMLAPDEQLTPGHEEEETW